MQKRADEVKYRQDFLCEFTQPADRLFTVEMLDEMTRPSHSGPSWPNA